MKRLNVTYFQRKPYPHGHFSIEFIFEDVRRRLADRVDARVKVLAYLSKGLWPRLYSAVECAFFQNEINHVTGDTSFAGIFLSKKKTVQTVHDCGFLDNKGRAARAVLWFFWLWLPLRRARVVTTVSGFVRENVLQLVGLDPSKVVVVPDQIDEIYRPVPKVFDKKCPVILQVGMAPNKNVLRLIEALEGIPCHLLVVGKIGAEVAEKLARHGIDYSNFFNISREEMFQKYVQCDLLAFVSTHEGFGMPIIEANTVERAVVAGNVTSMPEVAGDAACLVDPYSVDDIRSGILRVILDDVYREKLIENGRENRKRFDPQAIAEAYLKVYQNILDNGCAA